MIQFVQKSRLVVFFAGLHVAMAIPRLASAQTAASLGENLSTSAAAGPGPKDADWPI